MPDPFNLDRFVIAQDRDYARALAELNSGRKRSHWMWYVFPQFTGLGLSATSQHFAIQSLAEAAAYLNHPILGPRLRECAQAVLDLKNLSAHDIFGFVTHHVRTSESVREDENVLRTSILADRLFAPVRRPLR